MVSDGRWVHGVARCPHGLLPRPPHRIQPGLRHRLVRVQPQRVLELRAIAQETKTWKCNMKTAVRAHGTRDVQNRVMKWMAFLRRTGLRADYVVDEPTQQSKIAMFEHAMMHPRCHARDDAWRGVFNAVVKSVARESALDRVS